MLSSDELLNRLHARSLHVQYTLKVTTHLGMDSSCPDEQDPHVFTAFQSSIGTVKAFFYPFSNLKDIGGSDQQDVLSIATQMKNWTSDIYKHFKMPLVIKMKDDGTVQYLYVCKSQPSIFVARIHHDETMTNLGHHIKTCIPGSSAQTQALAAYASGSQYTEAKH
ncbi:hypothetical protein CPB84DRAFT_1850785 [Gymnopilus junonius]|uniref:Uncharacterized protein n=1 Tax=Gymnopilus junonius TaxID=109634 RepID=A0A9P5NGJ8_GYMJU|nr:hypothetical protein CPB84DRAFT_1850785 [Gymnopilus junonius]